MSKLQLIPSGKLNKDVDLNSLSQGDWSDASNVIVSTGANGGNKTVRMLESIKQLPITQQIGVFKVAFADSDGVIYCLYKNGANATIYKIPTTLDSITTVITYVHAVATEFSPDLKKIGNILVWNYYIDGVLLSWDTSRATVAVDIKDLLLSKEVPINAIVVSKTILANQGSNYLENSDFQFSARYKYDTGEFSVLGNFTEMFRGEKGAKNYTLTCTFPTTISKYIVAIELYARNTEVGNWKRIKTFDKVVAGTYIHTWDGGSFETLSTLDASMGFSAIPSSVKHIEVATDRLFISNFNDDYANDATTPITITTANGYTIPTGGNIKNYFGSDTTDAGVKSSEIGAYYKPFANNSSYSVGVAFFDSALKTRGVEHITTFETGKFDLKYCPSFNLAASASSKPSWAKYMQICISKNTNKTAFFEGFASSIYFELEYEETDPKTSAKTTVTKNKLSLGLEDVLNVKYCVIDISGMYSADLIYANNPNDKIIINCPDGTIGVTDPDGSVTGNYRLVEMNVVTSVADKIYCTWSGGVCLNDAIPNATKLHFEVFSPKQQGEDENLLFYGIGDMIDVSSSIPTTLANYKIGDSVFKVFEMNTYTDQFLYKGSIRSNPAIITPGVVTLFKSVKNSFSNNVIAVASAADVISSTDSETISFTEITTNGDTASLINGIPKITGFYDSNCNISLTYNFSLNREITNNPDKDAIKYLVYASIIRIPFNVELNRYDSEVQIGSKKTIYDKQVTNTSLNDVVDLSSTILFPFLDTKSILNTEDKISVVFSIKVATVSKTATVNAYLKEKIGVTDSVSLNIVGDRTKPISAYSNRTNVPTSATKTRFVVRSMSFNSTSQWNTSSGKPYLKAINKITARRTNAVRHSGNLIAGTEVNNISRFFALDTVEVPQENGEIMSLQRATRIQGEGDMLLAVCRNETSYMLLGENRSAQSDNTGFSSLTSNIIGSIRNLGDKTGVQNKESVYNHNGDIYWWDNFRNIVAEFTKNGVSIISDNGVSSYFLKKNGIASFCYDPFYDLLLISIGTDTKSIGYLKNKKEFVSEFDIKADYSLHYGERCLYFKNGFLYKSLENQAGNKYGEFFGVAYPSYIKLTANTIIPIIPSYIRVDHTINVIDYAQANGIKANLIDIQVTNENLQETQIVEPNFLLEDNKLYAHILRDSTSVGGLVNGNYIKGYNNNFKINLKDNSQENRIFGLEIEFNKVNGH